jgi:cytoskeletal protein RodZ
MAELLQDYFYADLSEEQLDQIEALLQGDESQALALASHAEAFYKKLRLPEPRQARGGGWWGASLGLLLLLALAWQLHLSNPAFRMGLPAPASAPAADPVTAPAARHDARADRSAPGTAAPAPHRSVLASASNAAPSPAASAAAAPAAPQTQPMADAVHLLLSAPANGPALLLVTLHLPRAQALHLRVLDAGGAEVKRLFDGPSDAGDHLFQWDGVGPHGPVGSGVYAVECQGADPSLTRRIRVDLR